MAKLNITPPKKALELVDKYRKAANDFSGGNQSNIIDFAKQCALIAVEEVAPKGDCDISELLYWNAVTAEIKSYEE